MTFKLFSLKYIVPLLRKILGRMARINQVGLNLINNSMSLYTKRTCSDNSEIYITSKLNMLYEQAKSKKDLYAKKRNLRKMVEGNHIDEII